MNAVLIDLLQPLACTLPLSVTIELQRGPGESRDSNKRKHRDSKEELDRAKEDRKRDRKEKSKR